MAVPRPEEMLRPALSALQDGQVRSLEEMRQEIRAHFQPTNEDLADRLQSGEGRFQNYESWAFVNLLRARLIEKPEPDSNPELRRITDLGRRVLQEHSSLNNELLRSIRREQHGDPPVDFS